MGYVKSKDLGKELVKVEFDPRAEESKIHHPFIA
jgi:hypothetical protein